MSRAITDAELDAARQRGESPAEYANRVGGMGKYSRGGNRRPATTDSAMVKRIGVADSFAARLEALASRKI